VPATPLPTARSSRPRRRFSLQLKLAVALVLVVLTPLLVSAYLVDQLGIVAANFASSEAAARQEPMDRALTAYRELFDTTKRLHAEIADRLARRPDFAEGRAGEDLQLLLEREPGLVRIAVRRADGSVAAEAHRPLPGPAWREKLVDRQLPGGSLALAFAVRAALQDEYQELKGALDGARRVSQIRSALPEGYRTTFLVLISLAALAAAGLGVVFSATVTRRIGALVDTARRVGGGALEARVELRGSDEMAELGSAFNTMLDDLDGTRRQIAYLQRIGAWQDVARRLAHEIKNPLTPIQLAVQQCVSSYRGDDERFARMLRDTGEIVEEEIAALRRLVDTFRTLGQLPKVEATPLPLAEVIEELHLDPQLAERIRLVPPAAPITVQADKLLLKRVLVNLVENAIHAGDEAGRPGAVVIGWEQVGATVAVTVDDHGRGVAAADRERIFEPYVTTKATGTGLGLAIAKKIALEHGGDLAVDVEAAPTGGARFVILLPLMAT
jgi:two-component system, NtrC family, nitrogen regulation sensor histidine kinase NtrY